MPNGIGQRISGTPRGIFEPRQRTAGGEFAGLAGTVKDALHDRWWRKELEEFQAGPVAKYKQNVAEIGQMAADENFDDIPGLWSKMQNGIMELKNAALQYKNNPHVSVLMASMDQQLANQFKDLTGGMRDMASMARSKAEVAKMRDPMAQREREERLRGAVARRELSEFQLEQARKAGRRVTSFGELKGDPVAWMDQIRVSGDYVKLREMERVDKAAKAWESPEVRQKFRELHGVEDYGLYEKNYRLTDPQEEEFEARIANSALSQLVQEGAIPEEFSPSIYRDMIRTSPAREAAAETAAKKINYILRPGEAGMNQILFDNPNMGAGRAADLIGTVELTGVSPLGAMINIYHQYRDQGMSHQDAKDALYASKALELMVASRFDISVAEGVASSEGFSHEIDDVIDAEADKYEVRAMRERIGGLYPGAKEIVMGLPSLAEIGKNVWQSGVEAIIGEEMAPVAKQIGTPESVARMMEMQNQLEELEEGRKQQEKQRTPRLLSEE